MALYAAAVRSALREVHEALRRSSDDADVVAYADDTYLLVTVDAIGEAPCLFAEVMGRMGLGVHPDKTISGDRTSARVCCRRHIVLTMPASSRRSALQRRMRT